MHRRRESGDARKYLEHSHLGQGSIQDPSNQFRGPVMNDAYLLQEERWLTARNPDFGTGRVSRDAPKFYFGGGLKRY